MCVHKVISTFMYCDLDVQVKRAHPLVMLNMPAKVVEDVHNGLVSYYCTHKVKAWHTANELTDGTTAAIVP